MIVLFASVLAFVWATSRFVTWWEQSSAQMHEIRERYDSDFNDYYDEVFDSDAPARDQDGNPPSFDVWWAEKHRPRLTAGDTKLGQYR